MTGKKRRTECAAFGVFNPRGTLLTSRDKKRDAEFAARILVGTDWQERGFIVDPITVTRQRAATTTPPESKR